jgi:carboxyl-terminal processing protease
VYRKSTDEALVFNLKRENIRVASVHSEVLGPDLGYVRISQFTDTTARELSDVIDKMVDEVHRSTGNTLRGLVLDLRNNPGGILNAAVDVSDLFLESGVIVTAEGRTPESRFTREASGGDILDGAALVILVNAGSASASEIVAGALQDHARATILGTSTYGKGLVQTVMPLSKGRAIKLTTSRYYTPSGDSIHEVGIAPDILIEGLPEYPGASNGSAVDRVGDLQLLEALNFLQHQRVMHSDAS